MHFIFEYSFSIDGICWGKSTVKPLNELNVSRNQMTLFASGLIDAVPESTNLSPVSLIHLTLPYSFHVSCVPMPYFESNATTNWVPCHQFVLSNRCLFFHCNIEQVTLNSAIEQKKNFYVLFFFYISFFPQAAVKLCDGEFFFFFWILKLRWRCGN